MHRKIDDHIISLQNDKLKIEAVDPVGSGGANHLYKITGFDSSSNPSCPWVARHGAPAIHSHVLFQNGPIGEVGTNGVTQEALIAILIDRMRSFQSGPFKCRENEQALFHLEEALMWLQQRTIKRMRRNVEGTNQQ